MDVTQIGLGVTLLVIGALTLIGPAALVSGPLTYLVTGATLLVTGYALLIGLWQSRQPNQGRFHPNSRREPRAVHRFRAAVTERR